MESKITLENDLNNNEDFLFEWEKHIGDLTMNKVKTKISLDNSTLLIETRNHYLSFIRGSVKIRRLPVENIARIAVKKILNTGDMILGIALTVLGFVNPIMFIIAILIFWTGISTKIVITTNLKNKIIIPSDSKKYAEKFVETINEIPMNR